MKERMVWETECCQDVMEDENREATTGLGKAEVIGALDKNRNKNKTLIQRNKGRQD